jgi:hypothetical protein
MILRFVAITGVTGKHATYLQQISGQNAKGSERMGVLLSFSGCDREKASEAKRPGMIAALMCLVYVAPYTDKLEHFNEACSVISAVLRSISHILKCEPSSGILA